MIIHYLDFLNENKNESYNDIIDYTYLKEDISVDKIKEICDTAIEHKFHSVCVPPDYVSKAYGFLDDSDVKISTVINYPEGDGKIEKMIKEVNDVISSGADEIDFVMDYKELKETTTLEDIIKSKTHKGEMDEEEIKEENDKIQAKYDKIEGGINDIGNVCHKNGVVFKVIIETSELTYSEIKKACELCIRGGADFIMTSTGKASKGAELEKVKYLRRVTPDYIKIKASGGIRTMETAKKFYKFVDRIGTSVILKK